MANLIVAGLRNKLTVFFGSIPGAVVAVTELLDLIDDDHATVFEPKVFLLAVATAVAFFVAKDANQTGA